MSRPNSHDDARAAIWPIRIAAAPQHGGVFVRTQRGYGLTEAGEQLLRWSRRVEGEFASLRDAFAARTDEPAGIVSVATTEPIAAGPYSVSLSRREADVALRVVRPQQGNVLARRIGEVGFALYASRA